MLLLSNAIAKNNANANANANANQLLALARD